MKVGLVAFSGVRVEDAELLALGLTMPGVVERGRVVASLPSLSLLTLAAMTPRDVDVSYHELGGWPVAQSSADAAALPRDLDLVAITSLSAQIREAYALADQLRAAGTTVVIGGLHATALPEEAAEHADAVAVGEGELTWPRIVEDFRCGRLQRRYAPPAGEYFDLADAPMPRFDLLDMPRYNRVTVQTSRGCPHLCEFCASSVLLTPRYAVKPFAKVIAEIRRIKELWPNPFIELADDNSFASHGEARRLLRALRGENVHWFTEADISIADDPELIDLMREAGCRQVLVGLESPTSAGLDGIEVRRNWKLRVLSRYERAVHAIQSRGVTVNGCFILGLDGDTPDTFDAVHDFVDRTNLFDVQITVQTPFPGTPLYARLQREGRLIEERAWHKCTLFDVNFVPLHMTPAELRAGLIGLARRLYDPAFVEDRRRRYFEVLHRGGAITNDRVEELRTASA